MLLVHTPCRTLLFSSTLSKLLSFDAEVKAYVLNYDFSFFSFCFDLNRNPNAAFSLSLSVLVYVCMCRHMCCLGLTFWRVGISFVD